MLTIALAQSLLIFTLPLLSHHLYRLDKPGDLHVFANLAIFLIFVIDIVWLHGYSVAVVRSLIQGYDSPPPVAFAKNMREGGWLVLSSLIYAVPIFVLFGAVVQVINIVGIPYYGGTRNYTAASVLFIAILAVHFALKLLARTVYDVGVARYAANDYSSSLFELGTNASILRKNIRSIFFHEFRQAILLGVYGLLAYLVVQIGDAIISPSTGEFGDDPVATMWAAVAVPVFTLGYLSYWYSSAHLFGQYAISIGIVDSPRKRKYDNDV